MNTYRQPFKGEYPITQYYGETLSSPFHTGIDYACPLGTPILASGDGVIRFNRMDTTGYGNCVIIEHDISHSTLYAHLNALAMQLIPGTKVKQGDVIGWSGTTGHSTGPHLHFEARKIWNDYRSHFDPMYLPLMTVDDSIAFQPPLPGILLKEPADLKDKLSVVAPLGAYAHNESFTAKRVLYPGTKLLFTGNIKQKDGITFCECKELSDPVWVAVHDGETQILDDLEE